MGQATAPEEIPDDAMVPVPLISARSRRFVAATGVLAVALTVLGSSLDRAGLVLSSLSFQETEDPLGFLSLALLLLTTFAAVVAVMICLKNRSIFDRWPPPLWHILEAFLVMFGLLTLLVLIPYLMLQPLVLNPYFSGEDDTYLYRLTLWVVFAGPFLVGLSSIVRLRSLKYGLLGGLLVAMLGSVAYAHLIEWASPPLFSSQLGMCQEYNAWYGDDFREETIGEVMWACPRHLADASSVFMLLSLIGGLSSGGVFLRLAPRIGQLITKRSMVFAAILAVAVLPLTSLATLVGSRIQSIPVFPIPESNLSRIHMESWIDPGSLVDGEGVKGYLEVEPSSLVGFSGVSWYGTWHCSWGGRGGQRTKGTYDGYALDFPPALEWSSRNTTRPLNRSPVLFCWAASVIIEPQLPVTRLWVTTLPDAAEDVHIAPCLYRSRLAFRVDPPTKFSGMWVVCYESPESAYPIIFKRADRKGSLYVPLVRYSRKQLKEAGIEAPEQLWEWESETQSLEYAGQTIFFAAARKEDTHVISKIYTTATLSQDRLRHYLSQAPK